MQRSEKIKIYDKGIAIDRLSDGIDAVYKASINYRTGDIVVPHLKNSEALAVEVAHFADCVRTRQRPLVDGVAGLRVVRLLEAAQESLQQGGQRIALRPSVRARTDSPPRTKRAA
jgi:predicted dehydrogenase